MLVYVNIHLDILPHTFCTWLFYTQTFVGIKGKQVALKCYELFRWHARSITFTIFTSEVK